MKRVAILAVVLGLAGVSLSDCIWAGGMTYDKAKITKVNGKLITFTFSTFGTTIDKALAEVSRIDWDEHEEFSEAEWYFSQKRYKLAIAGYKKAMEKASDDEKALIRARLAMAENPPVPTSKPAEAATPNPPERCYYCSGMGRMFCPDCKGTGFGKCECGGGFVVCAKCKGDYRKTCTICNGAGRIHVGEVRGPVFSVPRYQTCPGPYYLRGPGCNGTGEFECSQCKTSLIRGKVPCDICKGTARIGKCPKCNGEKRLPCTYCPAGTGPVRTEKPVADPSTTSATSAPSPKVPGALLALDALVEYLNTGPKHPKDDPAVQWESLTELLREDATKKYEADLARWKKNAVDPKGAKVSWTLTVLDVVPNPDGAFDLVAFSPKGSTVAAKYPAEGKGFLMKHRKNDSVQVTGTIVSFGTGAVPGTMKVVIDPVLGKGE